MSSIKKELNSMGSGWFVLRLSNDLLGTTYDLTSGYTKNSISLREAKYKKLFSNSKILIKTILRDKDTKLSVHSASLTSSDILKIAETLDNKISSIKPALLKLKTKACRGIYSGDVANASIRNILSELGSISDSELFITEEYFDWKCPYTGRDLKSDILSKSKNVSVDHIIPQNKEECGLNVFGNLIFVDKKANQDKRNISFENYIYLLPGLTVNERKERIKKIKDFQSLAKYYPDKIKLKISKDLINIYNNVIKTQTNYIEKLKKKI